MSMRNAFDENKAKFLFTRFREKLTKSYGTIKKNKLDPQFINPKQMQNEDNNIQ